MITLMHKQTGRSVRHHALLAFMLGFAVSIGAITASSADDTFRDPTRPPSILFAPVGAAETGGPVLQSVRISPGQRSAIISGEQVRLGDKFGGARVIKINETEVVLKSRDGLQTLKLFPDAEKRAAADPSRGKR